MPLVLKPREALPPFTFDLASPPPEPSSSAPVGISNNNEPDASTGSPPRPPMELLPEREMIMFGANPLRGDDEGKGLVRCTRCAKVFMEWAAADHKRICEHVLDGTPLDKKKIKADKAMKTAVDTKKRRASEEMSPGSPSKKAKLPLLGNGGGVPGGADAMAIATSGPHSVLVNLALAANPTATPDTPFKGMKKSEIKKLKKEAERIEKRRQKEREREEIAERKRLRISGPIDYDRQCGVINDKGLPCSRSLTCKTHTVGLKRAVTGRSRPYDELYLDWQRANNPNFKEPVPARVGGGSGLSDKKDKRKDGKGSGPGGSGSGGHGGAGGAGGDDDDDDSLLGRVEEMVHWARLSAERVKMAMCPVFNLPRAVTGANIRSLARFALKPASAARTKSASPANGAAANGAGNGAKVDNSLRPTSCTPLWAGHSEYLGVGELLTQALASRVKPQAHPARPSVSSGGTKITIQAPEGRPAPSQLQMQMQAQAQGQPVPSGLAVAAAGGIVPSGMTVQQLQQLQLQAQAQQQAAAMGKLPFSLTA